MNPSEHVFTSARTRTVSIALVASAALVLARVPAVRATDFFLTNDLAKTARFDFGQPSSWWLGGVVLASDWVQPNLSQKVKLSEVPKVSFRYTMSDNTRSAVVELSPNDLRPYPDGTLARLTFRGIVERYRTEERTRTSTVTKMVPETKTRTVTVTKYRSEERTRRVRVRDPATGRLVWQDQPYTVQVPYTEQREENYTVTVPVTEEKASTYTVQVPMAEAVLDIDGRNVSAAVITTGEGAGRRRILGVGLSDVGGVLVTAVDGGGPATRMKAFGPDADSTTRFALEPNVDRIVRINGQTVATVSEAVAEVQKSPVACFLTVSSGGRETTFEVELDVAPEAAR